MERAETLTAAGIPTEVLDRQALQEVEPHLNTEGYLGAAHAVEGLLNPFLFCWAYAQAARRQGALLRPRTPVTAMRVAGRRVAAVEVGRQVVRRRPGGRHVRRLDAAGWSRWRGLTRRYATPTPRHLSPSRSPSRSTTRSNWPTFYERIHGRDQAVAVGFSPDLHGALVVTEAVAKTTELHRRNSSWGLAGMAAELIRLYPALAGVRAVRAWGIPTSFTPDDEPIVGWMPERDNLFVAAAFLQTITAVPVVSEWMAQMILGESAPADLGHFAPDRFHPQ